MRARRRREGGADARQLLPVEVEVRPPRQVAVGDGLFAEFDVVVEHDVVGADEHRDDVGIARGRLQQSLCHLVGNFAVGAGVDDEPVIAQPGGDVFSPAVADGNLGDAVAHDDEHMFVRVDGVGRGRIHGVTTPTASADKRQQQQEHNCRRRRHMLPSSRPRRASASGRFSPSKT